MKISEARALVQLRKPERHRVERTLRRCATIEDLQHAAWRRWPRSVRGYVEGGADGEVSLARNRAAYESLALVPSPLRGVTDVDLRTSILGGDSALPFALAPTGYTRMMHTAGERAVARAALDAGIPYALSTMATTRLEAVADSERLKLLAAQEDAARARAEAERQGREKSALLARLEAVDVQQTAPATLQLRMRVRALRSTGQNGASRLAA